MGYFSQLGHLEFARPKSTQEELRIRHDSPIKPMHWSIRHHGNIYFV
jgi:hypothetical protein